MSKCCKCGKWWPHNWLCLKGLYVFFIAMFYLALVYAVLQAVAILRHPMLSGVEMWKYLVADLCDYLGAAIGFLTIAKVLGVLRKIKKAVSPCCCSREENAENHIETVVEHESK